MFVSLLLTNQNAILMKKITKQTVRSFLAFFVLAQVANVCAQNIVYEVPNVRSSNSIIREYKDRCYLVYNDDNGTPTFGYVELDSSNYKEASAQVPPLVINDMEIVDSIAYFCGKCTTVSYVVFGFFNVYDLFFNSGTISYCILSTITMTKPLGCAGFTEQFTDLLRIEPYVISSNDIHIFMVGESYYIDTSGLAGTPYRCLLDAYYDGSPTINLFTLEETGSIYFFNDIAVTSTNLIIVGDKHNGTGQYMSKHLLPPTITPLYFPSIYSSLNIYWSNDIYYYPVPDVRIEALGGDAFATVCKGYISDGYTPGSFGIIMTTYGSAINMADRKMIFNPYDAKRFRDLKFNFNDSRLYYVPEFNLTTSPTHIYCSDISSAYTIGANSENAVSAIEKVCSLDTKKKKDGSFASGFSNMGILNLWDVEMIISPCATPTQLSSIEFKHPENNIGREFDCNQEVLRIDTVQPSITDKKIITICE